MNGPLLGCWIASTRTLKIWLAVLSTVFSFDFITCLIVFFTKCHLSFIAPEFYPANHTTNVYHPVTEWSNDSGFFSHALLMILAKYSFNLQDFCEHNRRWPPLSERRLQFSDVAQSCSESCEQSGRSFFIKEALNT